MLYSSPYQGTFARLHLEEGQCFLNVHRVIEWTPISSKGETGARSWVLEQQIWVQIPTLLLAGQVPSGKLLQLSAVTRE